MLNNYLLVVITYIELIIINIKDLRFTSWIQCLPSFVVFVTPLLPPANKNTCIFFAIAHIFSLPYFIRQ